MTSIPLLLFSSSMSQNTGFLRNGGPDWNCLPQIEVALDRELPLECYGVRVEDETMSPALQPGMVGVFSVREKHESALMTIFSIGVQDKTPLMRKVVKNETGPGKSGSKGTVARKSFMTPTPLHIPGSRVSPIADSTHHMIYLKTLAGSEAVTLVPVEKLLWMHPLVRILKPEEYRT